MIKFNKSPISHRDLELALRKLQCLSSFSGGGDLFRSALALLDPPNEYQGFLTTSGTAALELACMDVSRQYGTDREVIIPCYTFSSCANAVLRAGLRPRFIDIDIEKGCIDCDLIEGAISERTCAVMFVDYAGAPSFDSEIVSTLKRKGLSLIVDGAQSVGSPHWRKAENWHSLDYVVHSFHDTKNISCGEGGVLFANKNSASVDVEYLFYCFDKGTNRRKFINGIVDKYTWLSVGSSFVISELNLAVLCLQLKKMDSITKEKLFIQKSLCDALKKSPLFSRIQDPSLGGNGHFLWALISSEFDRNAIQATFSSMGVEVVPHYVPLSSSPYAVRHGLSATCEISEIFGTKLLRFPCHSTEILEMDYSRVY